MKKFFGILLGLNCILPSFAYDDFVISIGDTVSQIKNKTPDIIDVQTITTLLNERDTIIVTSKKEGKGQFCVILENGQISDFTVRVSNTNSEIKTNKNYEIFKIDEYSEEKANSEELNFEIDLPPGVEWNK